MIHGERVAHLQGLRYARRKFPDDEILTNESATHAGEGRCQTPR
jgi:hypothetical protein